MYILIYAVFHRNVFCRFLGEGGQGRGGAKSWDYSAKDKKTGVRDLDLDLDLDLNYDLDYSQLHFT